MNLYNKKTQVTVPNEADYIKVKAKVDLKNKKSELKTFTLDRPSKTIPGINTVVGVEQNNSAEITPKQKTNIYSQPNSGADVLFTVLNFKVKDKVCNLGKDKDKGCWYEGFYKLDDNISNATGWIRADSIQSKSTKKTGQKITFKINLFSVDSKT